MALNPNVDESATTGNRSNYQYDLLGRVKNASGTSAATYTYDFEGNIEAAQ
ncbi:MAG: hypothetical protein HC767_00785 [Akkermansiaceae bacterium]|nr:hypothetical protein [Akkermansiaceae bacterium]